MREKTKISLVEGAGLAVLLICVIVGLARCQTLTVQGGVSTTHGLGDRAGPVIEARSKLPWLYARFAYAATPKAYLGSGNITTGDLCLTVPISSYWFGGGVELAHSSTATYQKTARRLLVGSGWHRGAWELIVFCYPPEWGTPNRSYGARVEASYQYRWLVATVRGFVQHHRDSLLPIEGYGGGIDLLVGVRWSKQR